MNLYAIIGAIVAFCIYTAAVFGGGVHYTNLQRDKQEQAAKIEGLNQQIADIGKAKATTDDMKTEVTVSEDKYNVALQRIKGLEIANGRLQSVACGLFDKNGRPLPAASLPAGTPPAAAGASAPAGCLLPETVRSDLRVLAADADAITARFTLARATALVMCAKLANDNDKQVCAEALGDNSWK